MSSKRKILVVDDEQEILNLLKDLLESAGYEVDTAVDGGGALDLVRAKIYDAAILDFNLPDTNGVMLHRQIRQMDSDLAARTLFTSGLAQVGDSLDYYATYGQGFLAKPFEVDRLLESVRQLFDTSR